MKFSSALLAMVSEVRTTFFDMRHATSHHYRTHPLVQSNLATRPRFQSWFLFAVVAGVLLALAVFAVANWIP
jgi:hypothetical protein